MSLAHTWQARGALLGGGGWLRLVVRGLFRLRSLAPRLAGAADRALAIALRLAPWLPARRPDLRRLAEAVAPDAAPHAIADRLCGFVAASIRSHDLDVWLPAEAVVRAGIGDCKNQAVLLCTLLRLRGVRCRVAVGLIGMDAPSREVHAWVELEDGWIADPTRAPAAMPPRAYASLASGVADLTPEYLHRRGGAWRNLLIHA